MSKKLSDQELLSLIELAKQPGEVAVDTTKNDDTDFERFRSHLNMVSGPDYLPVSLVWEYYNCWRNKRKNNKNQFYKWFALRFERGLDRNESSNYLVDLSSLKLSIADIRLLLIRRLYEKKKQKKRSK